MSKYTTELRYLVESGFDLGLKSYPIFNENHRADLNKKIIEHYYFREIGMETAGAFKFVLNRKMNEIMPKYNELFKSQTFQFDPIRGIDLQESYNDIFKENVESTTNGITKSESTADSTTKTNGRDLFNDTPQGLLDNGAIANEKYLTNATLTDDAGEQHGISTATGTTGADSKSNTGKNLMYTKTRKGSEYHNPSELLQKYRETIINIDLMIIENLSSLFMNIY